MWVGLSEGVGRIERKNVGRLSKEDVLFQSKRIT